MAPAPVQRLGENEVRVQGNLLHIRAHGPLTLDVAQQLIQLLRQLHQQHGTYYVIVDLHQAGNVPPELRRMLPEQIRAFAPAAMALYGGNTLVRAMTALVIGAITLVTGTRKNVATFASEASALAWLTTHGLRAGSSGDLPS